ncbi:MAG: hypothetical protein LBM92_05190, partial [Opitutaceae bacterium]|nr:hypothetical protein [Opitutaceae bacterium]
MTARRAESKEEFATAGFPRSFRPKTGGFLTRKNATMPAGLGKQVSRNGATGATRSPFHAITFNLSLLKNPQLPLRTAGCQTCFFLP